MRGELGPATGSWLFGFRCDPQADGAVEWYAIELDVEAIAILVRPGGSDPCPVSFLAVISHLIGNVCGCFARDLRFCIAHSVLRVKAAELPSL